jgi:hypothetical protein
MRVFSCWLLPALRSRRSRRSSQRERALERLALRCCLTWATHLFVAAAGPLATSAARADGPTGIELGVRTGYTLPFGKTTGGANTGLDPPSDELNNTTTALVLIGLDAGYLFNEHMLLGAYFQYGFGGSIATQDCQGGGGSISCQATDILVGGQFHYHLFPDRLVDPWFGIGAGYEALNFTTEGGGTWYYSLEGFHFNVQAGTDFKLLRNLGIGPLVVLNFGQFSRCSSDTCWMPNAPPAIHEWLTFGVRFIYDMAIPSLALPPSAPGAHSPSDDWAAPGDRPPPFR